VRTDETLKETDADSDVWKPKDTAEYTVNDLLTTTVPPGFSFSGSERNHLFISRDAQQFDDVSGISGLDATADSRSFALLDFDRDGRQDIVVVNVSTPTLNLYHNETGMQYGNATDPAGHAAEQATHMLAVRFRGGNTESQSSTGYSTRDGYGAVVRVQVGERTLVREHRCGEGFAAQNSSTLIIGLGSHTETGQLSVRWPSGIEQTIPQVAAGKLLTIYENPKDSPGDDFFTSEPYVVETTLPTREAPEEIDRPKLVLRSVEAASGTADFQMFTTTASWCSACKKFLPQLEQLRQAFDPSVLAMYGVPVDPDDDDDKLARYVRDHRPAYEMLLGIATEDLDMVGQLIAAKFKDAAPLPSTIITDQAGNVLLTVSGVPTLSEVRRLVDKRR